jgi:hypothetical protein
MLIPKLQRKLFVILVKALLGRFDKKAHSIDFKDFHSFIAAQTNGLLGECGLFSEVMCVF